MAGAIFCTRCGSSLVRVVEDGGETAVYTQNPVQGAFPGMGDNPGDKPRNPAEARGASASPTDAFISLHMVDTGEILPLAMSDEITIGRVSAGQSIVPDVNLTPYRAYDEGVSRLHASLKVTNSQVYVIDLSSANGTRLNGKILNPNEPHLLAHGDILTLGRFKIQVLIHN